MKICVYAICKNEEQFIKRWYNSVKDADYIVVLDTGSTDNTVAKFQKLNVLIHQEELKPFRFDVARNKALSLIPSDTDICISLDLDEVMSKDWRINLEKSWKENTTKLKYYFVWNFKTDGSEGTSFYADKIHSRNDYIWAHPIHEVLQYIGDKKEKVDIANNVNIYHYPDASKSRSSYLPLLEMAVKESPKDDRNMHYLGREYMYYGLWNKSIKTLKRHLKLKSATWKDERCASCRFIARCYRQKKDLLNAKKYLFDAIIEAPYVRESYVELAQLYYEEQDYPGVYHMCMEALKITHKSLNYINEEFAWDYTVYDLLSLACYYIGLYDESKKYCKIALDMNKNDERIKNNYKLICKKEHS